MVLDQALIAASGAAFTLVAQKLFKRKPKEDSEAKDEAKSEVQGYTPHWLPNVKRTGVLGDLLIGVNHYAIIVSDVAKSLDFYVNVLGLQQIRRPNFHRYGAWLTAGNMEIHLTKGPPVVHDVDHLIVGHLSFECDPARIHECLERLNKAGVPFIKNVNVPTKGEDGVVTQFFFRDPDGYYVEICNCDILTKFCLCQDEKKEIAYNETSVDIGMPEFLRFSTLAEDAQRKRLRRLKEKAEDLVLPKPQQAKKADPAKLANMLARCEVWGDIMQGETEEQIAQALIEAGNDAPLATRILRARKNEAGQTYIAPAVFHQGEKEYKPKATTFRKKMIEASAADAEQKLAALDPNTHFHRMFKKLDLDKSGHLNKEEVHAEVLRLCPTATGSEVNELFDTYDKDRSGSIDEAEFVDMCKNLSSATKAAKWKAIFSLCDDDDNGSMQLPELVHKLSSLGLALSDEEVEELFMDWDTDGDGRVSMDEFVAVMMGNSSGPHTAPAGSTDY